LSHSDTNIVAFAPTGSPSAINGLRLGLIDQDGNALPPLENFKKDTPEAVLARNYPGIDKLLSPSPFQNPENPISAAIAEGESRRRRDPVITEADARSIIRDLAGGLSTTLDERLLMFIEQPH
jgi:hypothetical protein